VRFYKYLTNPVVDPLLEADIGHALHHMFKDAEPPASVWQQIQKKLQPKRRTTANMFLSGRLVSNYQWFALRTRAYF
jgi:hypothetical protein